MIYLALEEFPTGPELCIILENTNMAGPRFHNEMESVGEESTLLAPAHQEDHHHHCLPADSLIGDFRLRLTFFVSIL
jgi:hypothetical protein